MKKASLVLSGGGARGAYQAGVIVALCELSRKNPSLQPFRVVTGISAGSINAAFVAGNVDEPEGMGEKLAKLWSSIHSDQVYRVSPFHLGKLGARLVKQLTFGTLSGNTPFRAFLDTTPLQEFLGKNYRDHKIKENLEKGFLDALAITATNYSGPVTTTFVQAAGKIDHWERVRRFSVEAEITVQHIMASAAIPILFPPIQIDGMFYGDGGLRNTTPLSPSIRLGSDRLIVVGVRRQISQKESLISQKVEPSLAKILSVVINGLLMDNIDVDLERMSRVNQTLVKSNKGPDGALRPVRHLWICPSKDLGEMAKGFAGSLPKTIRYLMGGLGNINDAADLVSYILFEPGYCRGLVELGYEDAMKQKDSIEEILLAD